MPKKKKKKINNKTKKNPNKPKNNIEKKKEINKRKEKRKRNHLFPDLLQDSILYRFNLFLSDKK